MAYQTFRVEVTRDETRDTGPVSIEITAYIDRMPETNEAPIGRLRLGVARRVEHPAAIHRGFRHAGRGARRDHRGLSRGRPRPVLRIFRRQRISGRGGSAGKIRREVAARRLGRRSPCHWRAIDTGSEDAALADFVAQQAPRVPPRRIAPAGSGHGGCSAGAERGRTQPLCPAARYDAAGGEPRGERAVPEAGARHAREL